MRSFSFKTINMLLGVALVVTIGASSDILAQKGKGKDRGGERNGRGDGGGRKWEGRSPGQQRSADFGERRSRQGENRGWQQRRERQRVEVREQRPERPQFQWRQERRERYDRRSRQQVQRVNVPWAIRSNERRERAGRDHDRRDRRSERSRKVRNDGTRFASRGRNYGFPQWIPPGQIRRADVHRRNAIRKAWKDQQKAYRRAARESRYIPYFQQQPGYRYREEYGSYVPYNYDGAYRYRRQVIDEPYRYRSGGVILNSPIYVPATYGYDRYGYGYDEDYYDNDDGFDWKSMLLRTAIGFILGNDVNQYGYGMADPRYSGVPAGYYDSYPGYQASRGYYPEYSDAGYYQDPNFGGSGLLGMLPIGDLLGSGLGGGFGSEILSQILAQGYEQGYAAGWYARDSQLREEYLNSLYERDDDFYDPYSVSIGDNRRAFSEGYTLGYQDALSGRRDYVQQFDGNADLFSVLLSNVIGTI